VNRPVTDKWALVIGVSKFADPTIPSLKYAAKDAQDFGEYLIKKANFAPDHVKVLVNEQATQRQIMSALGDKFLPQVVKKDDLVIIFYSSHGTPSNRDVVRANFLVAYDTQKNDLFATGIDAASLTRLLRERVHAERTLILMDACHSGGAADGAKDFSAGANFDLKQVPLGAGQMLISSSAENERSWESKRYPNGIFTYHLLKSMDRNGKSNSISAIFQDMQSSVQEEVREDDRVSQTPKLRNDMWSGNDLILAVQPSDPHPLPAQVKEWFDSQVAAKPFSSKPSVSKPVTVASKPATTNTLAASTAASESHYQTPNSTTSSGGVAKPNSTPAIVFSSLPGAKPSVNSYEAATSGSGGSQIASGFPNAGGFPNAAGFPNASGFPNAGGFPNAAGFPNASGFPNAGGFPNPAGLSNANSFPVPGGYAPGNFVNAIASANAMSGQSNENADGFFTPPDGSFTALLPSPKIFQTSEGILYSSFVGHARYDVLVVDMPGAKQRLPAYAANFMRRRVSQGFKATSGELRTINGCAGIDYRWWSLAKKCCAIFCANENHIVIFSASIGSFDKNEITSPFFHSIVVH
jgi:uncharacterized caspase-like protein